MRVLEIWINCPDDETADSIAESLIDLRLAACANKHQPVESSYRWKGNVEFEPEIPLVVKTREDLFDKIVEAVRSIHPYETPSILGVPVEFVNPDYRDWVMAETA
ncbi:divalent-cation tolerance protein CutA [Roseibium sp.]|uniref:divalent-cation tolerance protein CutA n=1 Tax=Roseibium sp. TaxID=1936156 RepID=UPI003A96C55B